LRFFGRGFEKFLKHNFWVGEGHVEVLNTVKKCYLKQDSKTQKIS